MFSTETSLSNDPLIIFKPSWFPYFRKAHSEDPVLTVVTFAVYLFTMFLFVLLPVMYFKPFSLKSICL